MAVYDELRREMVVRLVYDGPPAAGKTSSLYSLLEFLPAKVLRQFLSSDPLGARTQVFDWLELPRASLKDGPQRLRCQLIAVPGQLEYSARRRALLSLADAVVFVTGSSEPDFAVSRQALRELTTMVSEEQRRLAPVGFVLQANKQDLPGALAPTEVARRLGLNARLPVLGTSAKQGESVHRAFLTALRFAAQRARTLMASGKIERAQRVQDAQDLYDQLLEAETFDSRRDDYESSADGFEDLVRSYQPGSGPESSAAPAPVRAAPPTPPAPASPSKSESPAPVARAEEPTPVAAAAAVERELVARPPIAETGLNEEPSSPALDAPSSAQPASEPVAAVPIAPTPVVAEEPIAPPVVEAAAPKPAEEPVTVREAAPGEEPTPVREAASEATPPTAAPIVAESPVVAPPTVAPAVESPEVRETPAAASAEPDSAPSAFEADFEEDEAPQTSRLKPSSTAPEVRLATRYVAPEAETRPAPSVEASSQAPSEPTAVAPAPSIATVTIPQSEVILPTAAAMPPAQPVSEVTTRELTPADVEDIDDARGLHDLNRHDEPEEEASVFSVRDDEEPEYRPAVVRGRPQAPPSWAGRPPATASWSGRPPAAPLASALPPFSPPAPVIPAPVIEPAAPLPAASVIEPTAPAASSPPVAPAAPVPDDALEVELIPEEEPAAVVAERVPDPAPTQIIAPTPAPVVDLEPVVEPAPVVEAAPEPVAAAPAPTESLVETIAPAPVAPVAVRSIDPSLNVQLLLEELPQKAPEAGNAWPPMAARTTLSTIIATESDSSPQAWREVGPDAVEYRGKPGWRLFTRPAAWRFANRDAGRRELMPLVRRCVGMESSLPNGKLVVLTAAAGGFRLWEMTPDVASVADRVQALPADRRSAERRRLSNELDSATSRLLEAASTAGADLDLRLDTLALTDVGPLYLGQVSPAAESARSQPDLVAEMQAQLDAIVAG